MKRLHLILIGVLITQLNFAQTNNTSYKAERSKSSGTNSNKSITSNRVSTEAAGSSYNSLISKEISKDGSGDLTAPSVGGVKEMVKIPAGSFLMGDHTGGSIDAGAVPVHSVFVSEFNMDVYEVYWAKWKVVLTWAKAHGYSINTGDKDHSEVEDSINRFPVVNLAWVDAVKWCNARSEMMGFAPCFYTNSDKTTVYRTGTISLDNNCVNWDANGFRLPTEAEWEKAARGGLVKNFYPWPSTTKSFNGSMCNFKNSGDPYDNAVNEDDPKQSTPVGYYNGSQTPAGVDMKNGYGLYDMAANAAEWCWDKGSTKWYSQPGATADDCRGPLTTTTPKQGRVWRGSSFDDSGGFQCASRAHSYVESIAIDYAHIDFGIRTVRVDARQTSKSK